ncbi:MAG: hypothetical protein KN64_00770 [Sulfurovum sp. AS07-7]|nr:MAG: hypothetical protein KN64_00770 [Sulfurovum sp. AS07-7]
MIVLFVLVISIVHATSIKDFIDLKNCDQIVDKQVYNICYIYKYKGALAVWYDLDGQLVNKNNIKERPKFYSEKNIPIQYRAKSQDYSHSGFDRGHLANDASFNWSKKSQAKTYSMANISPQYPQLNRKAWIAAEKLERKVAYDLGSASVINLVDFRGSTQTIGKNRVAVPTGFYKIIYNDAKGYKKCFYYKNEPDPVLSLKAHQIPCSLVTTRI